MIGGRIGRWSGAPPGRAARQGWTVSHLPAEDIRPGHRLRPIDKAWARDLGHRMLSDGQSTPIDVIAEDGTYTLVVGAHRLDAAIQYPSLSPIEALILDPAIARERINASVAAHVDRGSPPVAAPSLVADLYALLGVTCAGSEATGHNARAVRAAALLGEETAEIDRLLDVHRKLRARVAGMLADAAIGAPQLEALARLDLGEQEKVAYLLLGGAESVAEATAQLPHRRADLAASPRIDAFVSLFEEMSLAEKESALGRLMPLAPPSIAIRWAGP